MKKQSTLMAAVAAAVGFGFAGQAAADVYGGSALNVRNLQIGIFQNGVPSPQAVSSFQFTATNTAKLNGSVTASSSANCGGTTASNNCGISPVLDPLAVNATGSAPIRANGNFSLFGTSANTYANSDSVIQTAQLVNGLPSSTQQIAESEIQTTGSANSNTEITSNTGFVFSFTVANGGSLSLAFEASPYLRTVINQANFNNGNAQANINAGFSLTNGNGDQISWSPQGSAANDCNVDNGIATCVETNDAVDLNRNISVSSNPSDVPFNVANYLSNTYGLFGINISGLANGNYTLAFNAVTSNSVRTTVPEPGVLALLGIGLLGLGATSRRKTAA